MNSDSVYENLKLQKNFFSNSQALKRTIGIFVNHFHSAEHEKMKPVTAQIVAEPHAHPKNLLTHFGYYRDHNAWHEEPS